MGRPLRSAVGGYVYHVLNRANAGRLVFEEPDDYAAFEQVMEEAVARSGARLLAYCLMPNHWHLVVWPRVDGELSRFVGWLALTHTQRRRAQRATIERGRLYQGRFKSFPVADDEHLHAVVRFVERNAVRANLVKRAEAWRWGSLYRWSRGTTAEKALLSAWPLPRAANWVEHVNTLASEAELASLRRSIARGVPFGPAAWIEATAARLGLESTLRPRGRPRKTSA